MPNGKPGDHPITDIVVHKQSVFGAPFDDLIREIEALARDETRQFLGTLVMFWPKDAQWKPLEPHGFEAALRGLLRVVRPGT
jgi:hypothetical protein